MKYFGTDGIRNKSDFFMKDNFSYLVGRALSLLYNKKIYIGYDTRLSSQSISYQLISGALSKGLYIYNMSLCSTPCIAFYSLMNNAIGVVITASHNPYYYNGIKIFINGTKLSNDEMKLIEKYIDNPDDEIEYGTIKNKCPLEYIKYLNQFKIDTSDILLDTANGSTSFLAKYVFENIINNKPNGTNINKDCGSTNIERYKNKINEKYNYLFSVDGDGDRLLILDKYNNIYTGDLIGYLLCKYYEEKEIVLTKMINPGVYNFYKMHNINISLSDIGDANLSNLMNERNISIGAEDSGHIINKHLLPFGDALLNALIIIKILKDENVELKDIINNSIKYPEQLINYTNLTESKFIRIKDLENKIKNDLDKKILFRKSGTEDLYRLYISCKDKNDIISILKEIDNE